MPIRYEGEQKDWTLVAGDSRAIFLPKETRGDWLLFFCCIPIQFAAVFLSASFATPEKGSFADVGVTIAPTAALVIGTFLSYSSVRVTRLKKIRRRVEIAPAGSNVLVVLDEQKLAPSKIARLVDLPMPGGSRCAILILDTVSILLWLEWRHSGSSGQPNRRYKKFAVRSEDLVAPMGTVDAGDDGPFAALSEALHLAVHLEPAVRAAVDDDGPLSQFYRSPMVYRFPISVGLGASLGYLFYRLMGVFADNVWKLEGAARVGAGMGMAMAMLLVEAFVFGTWLRIGFGRAIDRRLDQLRGQATLE